MSSESAPRTFVVPPGMEGGRVDRVLSALWPEVSRAEIKRAIERGAIRVNGRRLPKGASVEVGDTLSVQVEDVRTGSLVAAPNFDMVLSIAYESDALLLVDKPAGVATAPLLATERDTVANGLMAKYPELASIGYGPSEPGIVHRLDTNTSGLLMVAKSQDTFETLKVSLRSGHIAKHYLLVCQGDALADWGTIDIPLASHPKDRRRVLACIHPRDIARNAPKAASTQYRVLRRHAGRALVLVSAARALRHQIRAHFAAVDHPLVGDVLYGAEAVDGFERHALHAVHIGFSGAKGLSPFDVRSGLPAPLAALVEVEPGYLPDSLDTEAHG